MKRYTLYSLVFLIGFFVFSCKKKPKDNWTDTKTSGYIKIACDEDFRNLMEAEVQSFGAHFPATFVEPVYTTETNAINLLIEDFVRIALVTRDMNKEEKAKMSARNMSAQKYLIAFDGIAVINNKANNDSILGLPLLTKILNGEITEWSQINPATTYGAIRVIFNNKESGVLRYMADSIFRGEEHSPNLYALNTNAEVIETVKKMPNAIGVIGVNVLNDENNLKFRETQDQIRMMRIGREEKATLQNAYLPYAGDIAQENYPLWRPVYIFLSDPRSGLSAGFSLFMANEVGQKIILRSGLFPVTDQHTLKVRITDEYPN